MEKYFNHSPRSINNTFFGTPIILTKAYDYFVEDDVKESLDNHTRKKTSLGKSMRSTIISGVQLKNGSLVRRQEHSSMNIYRWRASLKRR